MPTMMYSIYVGNYDSSVKAKNDISKLNAIGFKAYVFSRKDHYALKVFASIKKENALAVKGQLERKGFIVELEEFNLNKNLHI